MEKKLNDLLKQFKIKTRDNRMIVGISDNSIEVKKDWIFVCRKKCKEHQQEYIRIALDKDAVVLCDEDFDINYRNVYKIENLEFKIPKILNAFYGNICKNLIVIGVTGTNGKTSVSGYITQILRCCSKKVLRIGTHIVEDGVHEYKTKNTTPDCFQLIQFFQFAVQEHIPMIVMEVSSHAIKQQRICFVNFDYIVYTNIASDHLDFHKTRIHYAFSKLSLMDYIKDDGRVIINIDDDILQNAYNFHQKKIITVGIHDAHFNIHHSQLTEKNISFYMNDWKFYAPLLGMFNIYNLAEAICVTYLLHIPIKKIQTITRTISSIPGRMEVLNRNSFYVWIDYAHTAQAIKKVLLFAQQVCKSNIYIIMGCGGNRDSHKRIEMANIACKYSTKAIFTTDNPRFEEPHKILFDLCKTPYKNYEVFENRQFAIKYTIKKAIESDIIIIAGKGDENTQEMNGHFYHFNDGECVRAYLEREDLCWK